MSDIRGHIQAVEQALTHYRAGEAPAAEQLRIAFESLLDFACAAAEDDLAECAEQGKTWLAEAEAKVGDGGAKEAALERLSAMVRALCEAYTTDVPEAVPTPPRAPIPEARVPSAPPASREARPVEPSNQAADMGDDEGRDPEILNEFLIESGEHLSEAEHHLLALDSDPGNVDALQALFRGFHTIKGLAGFLDFPGIESLAHAAEDVLTVARDTHAPLPAGGTDVILESVDRLMKAMDAIRTAVDAGTEPPAQLDSAAPLIQRLRDLAGHGVAASPQRAASSSGLKSSTPADRESEGEDEEEEGGASERRSTSSSASMSRGKRETIRVDAERLDRLVDMVGELVITESMVTRSVDQLATNVPGLSRHITRMDKITRELHELAGSLRMVPVRATFRKMARLARDVARKSGKRVSFKVLGEDAELDKTLVDRIGDPLVHMVRNAIDHGLEPDSESRVTNGKTAVGEVVLRALHRGGSVYIEVEDDGRGLDPNKILKRAIERGLVKEGESLTKRDIIRLICEPGFSTAEKVTSISGRGVGMDVVRQQIEAMSGNLEVTSEVGKGTCFSMQLPLTLAVIDGMVMRLGAERYVVPTLSVVRLVKAQEAQLNTVMGSGEVLRLGDELVPVVRPQDLFGIQASPTKSPLVVVVEVDFGKVAMVVDELLGQQQVVIKSLGDGLGDIPGLAGCAIMPDGRVGIVLDVSGIVRGHQVALEESRLEAV